MREKLETGNDGHRLRQESLLNLFGELQVAVDSLTLQKRFVHLCVLNRDRGLAGHGGQHIQVFLVKLLAVTRVELNDPQGFAIGS